MAKEQESNGVWASDIEPREMTADDVIKHLLDFAWDVQNNLYKRLGKQRIHARAGSIIDAYEPEYSLRQKRKQQSP